MAYRRLEPALAVLAVLLTGATIGLIAIDAADSDQAELLLGVCVFLVALGQAASLSRRR